MTTGELIKRARQNSKMTQKELAEKVGVSYQMIQAWENNRRNPKVQTMKKIASALGISAWVDLYPPELQSSVTIDYMKGVLSRCGGNAIVDEPPSNPKATAILAEALDASFHLDKALLYCFDMLNDKGKQKAVEQVEKLASIPEYRKNNNDDCCIDAHQKAME